ncbi:MAG: FAD-dependent oxidoreductase [Rhodospirillaceae bacterium]|nr:FAD-dependent oxidoreductase [Rhodospirillaceae bacterium]
MTDRVEAIVIGAGVVGLAVARELSLLGKEVLVLEAAKAIGTETSSRNSEIIHAGIYYPTGSLKAQLCVEGKNSLYDYCKVHGIPHRKCGKFIVATDREQLSELENLQINAAENGVSDLKFFTPDEVRAVEPAVKCEGALHSPSTGIVDSHSLMLAYQGEAEDAGALIVLNSPVISGRVEQGNLFLTVGIDDPFEIAASMVINSAGLHATQVARRIKGLKQKDIPPTYFAKGNYYTLVGRPPFSRPIYPIPEKAGLGVHVTVDLAGQVRFGPDVEWIDELNYDVDPTRAECFYTAVRKYYPALEDGAIQPSYSGIRPKIQGPGEDPVDFVIQGPETHGVEGLVNLFGIESPGLTASLPIARLVSVSLGLLQENMCWN